MTPCLKSSIPWGRRESPEGGGGGDRGTELNIVTGQAEEDVGSCYTCPLAPII